MANIQKISKGWRVTCLIAALSLSACSYINRAPTGYTAGHPDPLVSPGYAPIFKDRKSDTPLAAPMLTSSTTSTSTTTSTSATNEAAMPVTAVDTSNMPETASGWQMTANDLVARLVKDFGRPTNGVWLQPENGAPQPELESALRTAFQGQQINVADTAGGAPFGIFYMVNGNTVSINLQSGGHVAAHESGTYSIPMSAAAPMPPPSLPATTEITAPSQAPQSAPTTMREPSSSADVAPPPMSSASPDMGDNAPTSAFGAAEAPPVGLTPGQISSKPSEDDPATPPSDSSSYMKQ